MSSELLTKASRNRLSHSAASKFMDCPTAWKFHYKHKLRTPLQSSALLFGSAIDAAVTAMMKGGDKTPEDVFAYEWRFQEINGKGTYLPNATNIVYANSDYDGELLHVEDINTLKETYRVENPLSEVDQIYDEKDALSYAGLPEDRKKLLNHANWLCLYRKGMLMLKAVREEILPNVEEVLGSQVYVKLENQQGDSIIGYADLVVKWRGYDVPIILDFKTSTREYDKDSVLTSPQLTLYVHALNEQFKTRKAGFVIMYKTVMKNKTKHCLTCGHDGTGKQHKTCDNEASGTRCKGAWQITMNPKVRTQVIINDIPEQTENIVLDNMDYINQAITNGVFHRNFSSCIKPYGKCAYYNLCYQGKDDELITLETETRRT